MQLCFLKILKTLEFNHYRKFDKAPFIIYAHVKGTIEKIDGCKNNSENSNKTKVSEYTPPYFSMPAISSFRSIKISMIYTEVKIARKGFVNP